MFTDASGRETTVKVLDNTGVTGSYRSSEGKTGDAVWGTRGKWTMLTGQIGTEPLTLAILDLPQLAKDRRLFGNVLFFGHVSGFQADLQFQQFFLYRSVVGVLLLCNLGEGAEDELHPVDGEQQQVVYQEHGFLSSLFPARA